MLEHNSFYLYLIRHGQSEVNILPDQMGQSGDTKLTAKGKEQAKLLGQRFFKEGLDVDYVYSSDYTRAADTCKIVLDQMPCVQDIGLYPTHHEELREYSAGDWSGASRKETHTDQVLLRMAAMTNGFQPPNGESLHMVERRASQWLEDKVLYNKQMIEYATNRKAAGHGPQNVLVFSHGMTIKCLLHYIMGFDQSFTWKVTLENTSISKLYFGSKGWRLLTINDHAHLL
jgi:broad specificity phosphatase PhoE